jgi:hypothetical protein
MLASSRPVSWNRSSRIPHVAPIEEAATPVAECSENAKRSPFYGHFLSG